ncbi:MAG: hypothetical protein ACREDY_08765 [Bradyrhizobium sp.]
MKRFAILDLHLDRTKPPILEIIHDFEQVYGTQPALYEKRDRENAVSLLWFDRSIACFIRILQRIEHGIRREALSSGSHS